MKLVLKILKIIAILTISVSVLLFSASMLLQDKVADIILKSLNRNISTKLDVESARLSFLRKFPKASLELKNVLVHSSSDFDKKTFSGIDTDTLLAAKSVSVEFKITDIVKGNYNIESIGAKSGKVNLYSDTAGYVNYDISAKKDTPGNEDFTINLERINLTDIKAYYQNQATNLIISGLIKTGRLKSRISGDNIDFNSEAEMEINSFQLFNTIINKPITANLDLTLLSSKEGVLFKKGSLAVEDYKFGLDGFISSDNMLDLNITGENVDLKGIRNYLPEKYLLMAEDYNPSGIVAVDCKIKGPLTRTSNPHIEINTTLNNGRITFGKSDLTLNNFSFSGNYSNGAENNLITSSVSLSDLRFKLGSSEYSGSVLVKGFSHPKSEITLKGKLIPGELKEFFNIKAISTAEGSADIDLKLITEYWPKAKITFDDLLSLKPRGKIFFNSFTLGLDNNKIITSNVNGNLSFSENILADNLSFTYKDQNIKVDGEFVNLPEWVSGKPVQLEASADVSFNKFIPEAFLKTTPPSNKTSTAEPAFSLPGDIILNIKFKIDSLIYKNYSSSEIAGTLNYKPRILTFKSLTMKSMGGVISGTGFVVQNINRSVIARGILDVSGINVNDAFRTFNNFGQTFLKAENIAGTLSGTLSVLLPMDSLLKPQVKSITAEGKYLLVNGALINFDPVKQLSNFIELSELENIHFDKLENDFFIRNNFLYVPQMDIKSSAADLSVSGKHSFDNDYEYHIKVLLSEILSRKRKKNKSNVTEFGVVEEDGLGRTSILLKIEGKGEVVKVGYDIKAAGNEVKNNIKSERQTLKSILNEEYGWYKSDTASKQKDAEKKPRFKISWDETDSTKNVVNPPVVKKEGTIKNLLKKK